MPVRCIGLVRRIGVGATAVAIAVTTAACMTSIPGNAQAARVAAPAPSPSGDAPIVAGWTSIRSMSPNVTYDVPPGWTPSTQTGYRDPSGTPRVFGTAAARAGLGTCGASWIVALSAVVVTPEADPATAAVQTATAWADAGYRSPADAAPTLTAHPPEAITTLAGAQAQVAEVEIATARPLSTCGITTARAYAVAATGFTDPPGPTVVLVVLADSGPSDAVPDVLVRKMLTTVRPT